MSRMKKSKINKLEENKGKLQKPIEQRDHDNLLSSMENSKKNSPIRNSNDIVHPGHSTPFQKKYSGSNKEDSPEPCCNDSPISVPYTQDANEVAWDWQNSTEANSVENKTEDGRTITTPKQARIFQKKRILNSPLLYKPLRRRLIKADSIESVGKFAAELKALTEKMKIIQRNDEDNTENDVDNNKDEVENHEGKDQLDELIVSDTNTFANKVRTSFEELFDESIEDSMVKCSQEIEEKFNLCLSKKTGTFNSLQQSREKDKFIAKEKSKSESSLGSTLFSQNSPVLNVNKFCKTYSKTTPNHKKNVDIDVKRLEVKEGILKQSSVNNNIVNSHNENLQNYKNLMRHNNGELFEIPDDSFDDCLATCIEDDKLLSKTTEYDDIFPDSDIKSHESERNYKHSGSTNRSATKNIIKSNNTGYNSTSCSNQTSMDTLNKSIHNSSANLIESRKFFKTRSLSDSYFGHEKATNINAKPNASNSRQIIKYSSSSNLPSKSYVNTSGKNTTNENANTNKNIKSISDVENMRALNNSKIKNMNNLQTMLCTPEEIEKKRLEAKMRLEAKRKIQTSGSKPAITSEIPPKKIQR